MSLRPPKERVQDVEDDPAAENVGLDAIAFFVEHFGSDVPRSPTGQGLQLSVDYSCSTAVVGKLESPLPQTVTTICAVELPHENVGRTEVAVNHVLLVETVHNIQQPPHYLRRVSLRVGVSGFEFGEEFCAFDLLVDEVDVLL